MDLRHLETEGIVIDIIPGVVPEAVTVKGALAYVIGDNLPCLE